MNELMKKLSAMETFAEAWVAANAGSQTQAIALTRPKTPTTTATTTTSSSSALQHNKKESSMSPVNGRESDRSSVDISSPKMEQQSIASAASSSSNSDLQSHHHHLHLQSSHLQQHQQQQTHSHHHHNRPSSVVTTASSGIATGGSLVTNLNKDSKLNLLTHSLNESSNNGAQLNGTQDKCLPSPAIDRKDFDFTKVNAKSLPLHCIVESIASIQASLSYDTRMPWKRRPNVETDSYVIIPAATSFCDIVNTALQRLGYSMDIANTARGAIIIKNWKPLPLEKISENPLASVSDILGELTSVVTLKITILRNKPTQLAEIKDKLLKLLILQSHAVLRSTGCPLDEITLSQICRSPLQNTFPFAPEITDEIRRKFDLWWTNQLTPQANPIAHKILPFVNPQQSDLDFAAAHNLHSSRDSLLDNHHTPHHNLIVHPALQTVHSQYPSQKTRMRTSFDPEMELPKLQRWFQENPHPSRQQIQSYVLQLNSLESRRGRKPLDVNNVVYWFKNARAAQKRAEMRGSQGLTNGFGSNGMLLSQSEYMKSSPSAPSDDIDNLSQHSDDMDDDDVDRPMSPQLPLSLTTHERNRTSTPLGEKPIKMENNQCSSPTPSNSNLMNNNNINSNNNNNNNTEQENEFNSHNNNGDNGKMNNSNDRDSPPIRSPQSEDLDIDDQEGNQIDDYRSPSPDSRRDLPFPMTNSMFSHSIMYMSHYMPGMQGGAGGVGPGSLTGGAGHHAGVPNHAGIDPRGLNLSSSFSSDERRKRNRTFIDPVTEVPKLEQWFSMNTHPSHNLILKYTEDLNRMPYRQKFPRLESKNVQFWFKNRRAKCKRLKMSLYDSSQLSGLHPFHHSDRE